MLSAAATAVRVVARSHMPVSYLRSMCTMTGPDVQNVPLVQVYPDQAGASRREKELFPSEHEELPRVADHGFKYFTSEEELKGRNQMVQKALSTRTATLSEMRTFRKHQLIHKFRTHEYDTGSGRVQGVLILRVVPFVVVYAYVVQWAF